MSKHFNDLLALVEAMAHQSGSAKDFGPTAWLNGWLQQPVPSLNNEKPADVLETHGYEAVSKVLACMQFGAYK